IPPKAETRLGISLIPRTACIPLIRCTSKSPATPVPYSFQQRQRATASGSKGFFGAVPSQVSQSRFSGDKSGGGGYSHAPVGSLRPKVASTRLNAPIAPWSYSSFALAQRTELVRCAPTMTNRSDFFAATTRAKPSAGVCENGFSQYTSLPAANASTTICLCQ